MDSKHEACSEVVLMQLFFSHEIMIFTVWKKKKKKNVMPCTDSPSSHLVLGNNIYYTIRFMTKTTIKNKQKNISYKNKVIKCVQRKT